jgi:hypothetical protein
VIHDSDELLKKLLKGGALRGADVDVAFEAPTREWAARRNAPVFNAYLFDIREDVKRRARGATDIRDERGVIVSRRRPPRWFRLSYLITAWTSRPEDEHRLLSAALATLLPHEIIGVEDLPDAIAALGFSVTLAVSGIQNEANSLAEIWTALGGELKPSLDIVITVPFTSYPDYDAGPPVTEGTLVRAREIDGPIVDERAHTPHHLTSPAQEPGTIGRLAGPVQFGKRPR